MIFVLAIIIITGFVMLIKYSNSPGITKELHSSPKENKSNLITVNGVEIDMTQEEIDAIKQKKDKELFQEAVQELKADIQRDLEQTDDIVKQKVLNKLYYRVIETPEDFQEVDFMYNEGQLRSNEEVAYFKRWKENKEKRDNFDDERHTRNVLWFIVPLISVFFITCAAMGDFALGAPIALVFGLISAMIGSIIGNSINISKAKEYCIDENDPRLQSERLKRKIGVASTIATGDSIVHHTKSAVKDVMNVDGWKEMK